MGSLFGVSFKDIELVTYLYKDVNHPDEPMPEDDEGEDADIVIGRAKESFKCPITQTWLEEPVTS